MAKTYTSIATQTLTTSAASVTFSSISGAYTDLVLVIAGTLTTGTDNVVMQFNGDTGNNYSVTSLLGDGSAASSFRSNNIANAGRCAMGTSSSSAIYSINNYSDATTYKTVIGRGGMASYGVDARVSLWRNTNAINSILVFPTTYSFNSGTVISLYGITKPSTPVAKATGGTITTISGYTVHTFTSTGTFTPSEDLQVEYLVVAGGGGGYFNGGSAGGAGGFRTNVGGGLLSCSSGTAYTTIVGAGAGTNADGSPSSFNGINTSGGAGASGGGTTGGSGGSGAGGRGNSGAGGAGNIGGYFPVEGYAGGRAGTDNGGGGGGGAGGVGGNGSGGNGGVGGIGRASLISGTSTYYAGGGGGSTGTAGGNGGLGGGGNGRIGSGAGGNATVNTGGGGGGTREGSGGLGGSGIVIVRYRN